MIQEIFDRNGISADATTILNIWNEPGRYYHDIDHLNYMIDAIQKLNLGQSDEDLLIIAAVFHDIVYDAMKFDNEEKSAEFFMNCCKNKLDKRNLLIKQIILDTKSHKSNNWLSKVFCDIDMDIVLKDYNTLLEWEEGIYNEYKGWGDKKYKEGRLKFLNSLLSKYPQNAGNLMKLIQYVEEKY